LSNENDIILEQNHSYMFLLLIFIIKKIREVFNLLKTYIKQLVKIENIKFIKVKESNNNLKKVLKFTQK